MAGKVFISYASVDKETAQKICAALEQSSVPCWIAPRDIDGGENYPTAIMKAVKNASVIVLPVSASSIKSDHVKSELLAAFNQKIPIIPFILEDVTIPDEVEYMIGARHWVNAVSGEMNEHLVQLTKSVKAHLGGSDKAGVGPRPEPVKETVSETSPPPAEDKQLTLFERISAWLDRLLGNEPECCRWQLKGWRWVFALVLFIPISFFGAGVAAGASGNPLKAVGFVVLLTIGFLIYSALTDRGNWSIVSRLLWIIICFGIHRLLIYFAGLIMASAGNIEMTAMHFRMIAEVISIPLIYWAMRRSRTFVEKVES